jgi:uridine kinase
MKLPIPHSGELLDRIKRALTPKRLPLLIAIDGADGVGKSSLASWLAWQLGMPAVQLDLYLTNDEPIQWLTADLDRAVARRLGSSRPVIVDGVLVLDALDQIGREADFLVWVDGGGEGRLAPQIATYRLRQKRTADFTIEGYTD